MLATTNRFEEALRALGRAPVLDPNQGKALRHHSQVLVRLGDLVGGLSLIDELVAKGGSGNDAKLVRAGLATAHRSVGAGGEEPSAAPTLNARSALSPVA